MFGESEYIHVKWWYIFVACIHIIESVDSISRDE